MPSEEAGRGERVLSIIGEERFLMVCSRYGLTAEDRELLRRLFQLSVESLTRQAIEAETIDFCERLELRGHPRRHAIADALSELNRIVQREVRGR